MDLKLGSSGLLVYALQERLYQQIVAFDIGIPYPITGTFDKNTEASVKNFQSAIGLDPTGVVDDLTSTCITRSTFDFDVGRPQIVLQPALKDHCWAAATSSWLGTRVDKPKLSTQELVDMMKKIPGALDADDELITNSGWIQLKNKFGMNFNGFGGTVLVRGMKLTDFTPSFLLKILKSKKQVMLAYNYNEAIGHTVVAFGLLVKFTEGELKPNYYVKVMDPLLSSGPMVGREINLFKYSGAVVVFSAR